MKVREEQKPAALAALYNASRVQGMALFFAKSDNMSAEDAGILLEDGKDRYFDYLQGRVMKMDFGGDDLDFRLYDRDNGQGAGDRAVQAALAALLEA